MQLKYVGDMPLISKNGVGFDHTQPDKYKFLHAAVELLEALSYGAGETTQHLYRAQDKELSSQELMDTIKKYVSNLEAIFKSCDHKAHELIHELVDRVKANDDISEDEKVAWLENIKIMRDYYLQYVTNENAYQCALNTLADRLHSMHIETLTFPIGRNHGLVLSHLIDILRDHKPPYDATLRIIEDKGVAIGELNMNRSKPLNI